MKVSVIIPYNKDRGFLSQAVASVENQLWFTMNEDYELIVEYGDCGVSTNINNALKKCKGEYIKLCGEDDLLTPNCLKDLYTFAVQHDLDFVCANAINFQEDGTETVIKSFIPRTVNDLAMNNPFHGGTLLYRRTALPVWDESMWTAEEYEISLKMAAAGCKFGYLDSVVFRYRLGEQQKSGVYWQTDPDTKLYRFEYIEQLQGRYLGNMKPINRIL